MDTSHSGMNRRSFIKRTASVLPLAAVPSFAIGQTRSEIPANERLNLAFVGVGGKGVTSIIPLKNENIIAFCDVDERRITAARGNPRNGEVFSEIIDSSVKAGAKWYKDYRKMFEELGDKIDGVVISTPDHMHYPVAMTALNMGIHVYCEKPLTHTVQEARWLDQAARKNKKLATQMGNQGHSNAGVRLVREWMEAGVIGTVRELHSWTNRPIWPQGIGLPDHSEFIPVVPRELDWKLWLGVAEDRPFDPAYVPFNWRGWWDFGCGAVGDMGCHIMDAAYYGLDLSMPVAVQAVTQKANPHTAPSAAVVKLEFAASNLHPKLNYFWYEGGLLPPIPKGIPLDFFEDRNHLNGSFFIGDDAVLYVDTYSGSIRIYPDEKFRELRPNLPPQTIPRVRGDHHKNWTDGIRGELIPCSNFEYAAGLTEMSLLGNLAMRAGTRIEYDSKAMKVTNLPEANKWLTKEYPKGWILS